MLSCHLSAPDLNSGRGKNSLLLTRRTMARSSSRKRLNLSPPEEGEEGWILVDKRRRRAPTPPPAPDYRVYLILNHEETSTFHTTQRLEREHPDLRVRVQEKSGLAIYIKPLNEEAAFSFARLSRETTTGISLGEVECRSNGIVSLYPLGQSLRPILEDPRVTFARCIYNAGHCRREPTRQVEVTFRGPLPASLDLAEVLQDRRSLRRVQRETSLLTVYRDTEDRKQLGCTMSELWREPPRLVQGLPQTAEEAPPSPLGCDRHLAPKEPGCLPSSSSCLTPPSPSPSMDVVDTAPTPASPPTQTPQQEDASTQTCRKRKGRPCQTTPPPTEDAVVQMTPETETQATQTSPETTNQDTQTPSTTTMDAETSALYPSTLVKPPTPVWNEVFAPSVTPTRMDLLTLCNALVTLWKEYDEDENNYDSLESPIRTVMFETLSAALRFRRPDYPRKCPRKDPARDALWPK